MGDDGVLVAGVVDEHQRSGDSNRLEHLLGNRLEQEKFIEPPSLPIMHHYAPKRVYFTYTIPVLWLYMDQNSRIATRIPSLCTSNLEFIGISCSAPIRVYCTYAISIMWLWIRIPYLFEIVSKFAHLKLNHIGRPIHFPLCSITVYRTYM